MGKGSYFGGSTIIETRYANSGMPKSRRKGDADYGLKPGSKSRCSVLVKRVKRVKTGPTDIAKKFDEIKKARLEALGEERRRYKDERRKQAEARQKTRRK